MSNKSLTTGIVIGVTVILIGLVVRGSTKSETTIESESNSSNNQSSQIDDPNFAGTIYWGTTCPYCHNLFDWMEENKIEDNVNVIKKEIYENRQNSQELSARAKSCGMNPNMIGVPFMYTTQETCLSGMPDIIEYLELVAQAVEAEPQETNNDEEVDSATESAERIE